LSGWDEAIGEIPVWDYDADRMAWGHPGQYYILINNLVNNNPVKHMWISWIYDFDTLASGTRVATNIDWYPFTGLQDHGLVDEWFDSSGNPTTNYLNAVYGRITFNLDLYPNPEYEEIWLGLYSNTHYVREVYVKTLCVEACKGDFDGDGDVDGSDLAAFAANFGRTDCGIPTTCQGDFDNDGDVDGSDLSVFAADFGRTDCPTLD
jgi:hypothetical protein